MPSLRTVLRTLLLFVVASIAIQSYLRLSYTKISNVYIQRPVQGFQGMVDGTADKPFVARALVPFVVRHLAGMIAPEGEAALVSPLQRLKVPLPEPIPPGRPGHVDLRSYAVWLTLAVGSMVLLADGVRATLNRYYEGPTILFDAMAAASVIAWPSLIWYANYIYDAFTPTVVVWTLLCAIRRRWLAYYGLLILAALHKETMVVIPLAVGYLYWREWPRRRLFAEIGLQVAGVAAIRLYLSAVVFAANGGPRFNAFWYDNHNVTVSVWLSFLPTAVIITALVVGLVLADWADKPRGLKAMALVVVPLLILAVPFGYVDEIRQYSEGYPGLICLAFPSLVNALNPGVVTRRPGT